MSATGLSRDDRQTARRLAVQAMHLLLVHRDQAHYTQGPHRWDGINRQLRAIRGEYPFYMDCSSSTTWALWTATRAWHLPDFVNDANWRAGYTGTQITHARQVTNGHYLLADLAFYGDQGGGVPKHVAMVAEPDPGSAVPHVISMGSEAGPFFLPADYRGDFRGIWRSLY